MRFWGGKARRQAGDTIIEVLLAIVVISVVIAGAYQATNSGLRIGQNAIERTQASETTSAQAEALRSLRDLQTTNTNWDANIKTKARNVPPSSTVCNSGGGTPTAGSSPFWLNTGSGTLVNNGTTTKGYLRYWIEAYKPAGQPTNVPQYIDFYIFGCWRPVGESNIQDTGIVIRLTEE